MRKTEHIAARVDERTARELTAIAEREDRSISNVIRQLIRAALRERRPAEPNTHHV